MNESNLYRAERQWFRVQTTQEGWLLVEALTLSDGVNPHLYLFDADFKELAEDGDAGPGWDSQIAIRVQANETYHIAVSDEKSESGPYLLLVNQPDELPPTPPFPDKKFPRDSYSNERAAAEELTFHATGHAFVAGTIDPVSDEDWFVFMAPQTGRLLIKAETPHSGLDTLFQLFRDEDQVAEDRNRIVFRVTTGERYWLRMKANDPITKGTAPDGNYLLRLRQLEE